MQSRAYKSAQTSGLSRRLINLGVVRTSAQAHVLLLFFALGALVVAGLLLQSITDREPDIPLDSSINPETMLPHGTPFPD